jgi:hypothetical protein
MKDQYTSAEWRYFACQAPRKRAPVGVSQMFVLTPRALDHNEYQGQGPRYMS